MIASRNSLFANWPMVNDEFRHREVFRVAGCQRSFHGNRCCRDEAVCLVQGHSAGGELAPPTSSEFGFFPAGRQHPEPGEQRIRRCRFLLAQAARDFLDIYRGRQRYRSASKQLPDSLGCWATTNASINTVVSRTIAPINQPTDRRAVPVPTSRGRRPSQVRRQRLSQARRQPHRWGHARLLGGRAGKPARRRCVCAPAWT
jgi:hypothetical protein